MDDGVARALHLRRPVHAERGVPEMSPAGPGQGSTDLEGLVTANAWWDNDEPVDWSGGRKNCLVALPGAMWRTLQRAWAGWLAGLGAEKDGGT